MSNGQNDSQSDYIDEELAKIVSKIEQQHHLFGLNKVKIDQSTPVYLSMTEDEISRLSPEELSVAEIKLASFGFAIQKHLNMSHAIRNWANRNIDLVTAKSYSLYDKWMKFDERRCCIMLDNQYGERLSYIVDEHSIYIDEFAYLSQAVQHVSDAFGRLSRIRRKD